MRASRAIMRHGACAVSLFLALALAGAGTCTRPAGAAAAAGGARGAALPPVFVWAWERADDLRFLAGKDVGVAPLVATLTLDGDRVRAQGRRQPLALPPGAVVLPVVRIELARRSKGGTPPTLSARQRIELVARLVALAASVPGARGLQVDFDAPLTARAFERALLLELRRALPAPQWLSITALASWCSGDRWLSDLPVDEVVPMLFRMGPDGPIERARLAERGAFPAAECADALGLSTDEPAARGAGVRRVYWFHPGAWSSAALERALAARIAP